VLTVEDWAEIRRLCRAERMSISQVARVLGISRNTVRSALASDAPPKYQRRPAGSIVDGVEPRIRELLRAYPTMPATVIAERLGWTRSVRVLSSRVAELRPAYLPPDPAGRTSYEAGEIAQCDLWFPPIMLPVGFGQTRKPTQLPVLTMVTGYSRWLSALLIPTRTAADLFAGWWQLISGLYAWARRAHSSHLPRRRGRADHRTRRSNTARRRRRSRTPRHRALVMRGCGLAVIDSGVNRPVCPETSSPPPLSTAKASVWPHPGQPRPRRGSSTPAVSRYGRRRAVS